VTGSTLYDWRWRWALWLGSLCIALASCAVLGGRPDASLEPGTAIVDPNPRAGAPAIFVAMPNSPTFLEVRKSLISEVARTFNVETFVVNTATTADDLGEAVERANPACLVLMNNATMRLLSKYERAHPDREPPPTVLLMASLIEEVKTSLKRATGIEYEVPGVTAFVNLRTIIRAPVRRVGVIYRPALRKFVERQKGPAAMEHIEIVPAAVPTDVTPEGLRDALEKLVRDQRVDAVWMLNDSALVRDSQFRDDAWRAELGEAKVPLIVGVANLVNPASPLGMLAVVPDHEALGLQAASLIFELADDGWRVEGHPTERPLSVKTVVDIKMLREKFGLRPDALKYIDKALE
jgi:hypothetical protein